MGYDISNDIYVGTYGRDALFHFNNASIVLNSIKGIFSADVIGNELPIDTFQVTVRYDNYLATQRVYGTDDDDGEIYLLSNDNVYLLERTDVRDILRSIPYGTPVWWFVGNSFFAKTYASKIERIGKYAFRMTCISGVGLLDDKIHVGGLYNGQTFETVFAEIVGDTFGYVIDTAVKSVRIYGHLPYATARQNLHRLLFAVGAVMVRNTEESDYSVRFLTDSSPIMIPAGRIALGGSISYQLPSNKVEITEHGFYQTPGDEEVVLYDNSGEQAVENLTVLFQNAPAYDVAATDNLAIAELGVNYAIVSGTGTLTGKLYTHSRQIFSMTDNPYNDPERTRRVTDNELVNSINSRSVANRVLAYYMRTRLIKAKMMLENEIPGSYVHMKDGYGDPLTGYIQRMEFMPTSIMAADCEIADGYFTDAYGNTYTKRALYRYRNYPNADTVVYLKINTKDTKAMRIALIGGGTGGQAGYDGENGHSPIDSTAWDNDAPKPYDEEYEGYWEQYLMVNGYSNQQPAQGGAAGEPGTQGKIIVFDLDLSSLPSNSTYNIAITLNIGAGGAGGASNGASGSAGGDTSIAFTSPTGDEISRSSSEGVVVDGWADIMTGDVFMLPGADGIKGGNGGMVDAHDLSGTSGTPGMMRYQRRISLTNPYRSTGYAGLAGESVQNGTGGAGGAGFGYDGTQMSQQYWDPQQEEWRTLTWTKGYNEEAYLNCMDVVTPTQFPQAASGGGGGGAAYGANGSPGTAPVCEVRGDALYTGNGGNGASAAPPSNVGIGCGGNGGNGGGAGGNGGGGYTYGAYIRAYWFGTVNYGTSSGGIGGRGGQGGAGSRGGKGGEGAVIIYY